jgi:long-chain fatty acid transport protein
LLQPTVAYRINQYLSVGAGFIAMCGILKSQVAINNVLPGVPDGKLVADDEVWGFGANLGVMVEFSPSTRVGVTWTSPIKLDFSAPAEFSGLAPGLSALLHSRGLLNSKLDLGMTVPQGVMVSAFHQINETGAIPGSFGWQQWSKFGRVEVGIDSTNPTSTTLNPDYQDTYHVAVGVQLRPAPPWVINAGVAYDTSFQDTNNVSPLVPAGWAWRFGIGTQYSVTKAIDLGGAFEYYHGGDLRVNRQAAPPEVGGRGDLVGVYPNASSFFLTANLNWRF